jgi:hypothetical protein
LILVTQETRCVVKSGGISSVSLYHCHPDTKKTVKVYSSSSAYSCPHSWGTGLPYELHIRRSGHNPPRGPSAGWWVLTTAIAAGTNSLTCLPKHERDQDIKFLVTHLMTDQRCSTSAMARRSALTAGSSSSLSLLI